MRRPLLTLAGTVLLAACGLAPAPDPPPGPEPQSIPGGGVATVRADLAGTGNPWLTLPDQRIEERGRAVCSGLAAYGTAYYLDLADTNETTSPRPDEKLPDLNRLQTLAMVKASVDAFCPDRIDMITW
jgi:hypothetical protein